MSVIVAKDLCRTYGSRRGISDVNLTINAGEIFGFLGPNGAGKSTAIRVLMGLLRASSGTARIFGKDCWREGSTIRRDIGYVAGDVRLYSWLTTRRGLRMISKIHGRDLLPNGLRLAERFRLEPDLVIRKMSRGNRQKVALVLALAHAPQLVILDEPTSGLDPNQVIAIRALIKDLSKTKTVVVSTHIMQEVEAICENVIIINKGKIVADDTLTGLRSKYNNKSLENIFIELTGSNVQQAENI